MLTTLLVDAACALLIGVCLYFLLVRPKPKVLTECKTMIVLGSGGHTSEMFRFLKTLNIRDELRPRCYIIADSDAGSFSLLEEFERDQKSQKGDYWVHYIPRSRVVGQSYFTSIFTTLYSFIHCAFVVAKERPSVLIANGPGTCLPLIFCAWLYRTIRIAPCALFLLESYACVEHQSLTGKLCSRVVDRYCVQWPKLLQPSKPHIVYTGRIPLSRFDNPETPGSATIGAPSKSYVLVTVGSTLFESLIETIDTPQMVTLLKKFGFSGLHVQHGKGSPPKHLKSVPGFEVVVYDYKMTGWADEMKHSALVIGHAGAGTILDSLEARKPIIVVANDKLMSQHQTEISNAMRDLGFLFSSKSSSLTEDLPVILPKLSQLEIFPKQETQSFNSELLKEIRDEPKHVWLQKSKK